MWVVGGAQCAPRFPLRAGRGMRRNTHGGAQFNRHGMRCPPAAVYVFNRHTVRVGGNVAPPAARDVTFRQRQFVVDVSDGTGQFHRTQPCNFRIGRHRDNGWCGGRRDNGRRGNGAAGGAPGGRRGNGRRGNGHFRVFDHGMKPHINPRTIRGWCRRSIRRDTHTMAFITHGHNHYFALRRRVAGRIDGVAGSPGASMASPGRRAHRWRRRVAGRIDGVAGSPGASMASPGRRAHRLRA
jgi:hypothetical protein